MYGIKRDVDAVWFLEKEQSVSIFVKKKSVRAGQSCDYPKLFIDYSSPSHIYAYSCGISSISFDAGNSWSSFFSTDSIAPTLKHVSSTGIVFGMEIGDWGNGHSSRIVFTLDKCTSWSPLNNTPGKPIGEFSTSARGNLVCYTANCNIYVSKDTGVSWQKLSVYYNYSAPGQIGSIALINDYPLEFIVAEESRIWHYKQYCW